MATFSVPDMHCGKCRTKIEEALLDADDAAFVDFDMDARTVSVDSPLDPATVTEVLAKVGYQAKPVG